MRYSQDSAGDVADGMADEGHGKLVASPAHLQAPLRLACRDLERHDAAEHHLIARIADVFTAAGFCLSRAMIVNYYISLKTNPFVILAGPQGSGKSEFVSLFAEALLGRETPQFARISGGVSWPSATGHDRYYRMFLERFTSLQFLDLLQEAADPASSGKLFLACFDGLRPQEFTYLFSTLLTIDPDGRKYLNIPGMPENQRMHLPPNLLVTATINTAEYAGALTGDVLRHAALIEFRAPRVEHIERPYLPPPPVGYQRIWQQTTIHDPDVANRRLAALIGAEQLARLRCSPSLARLLWEAGIVLTSGTLQGLTIYVANSFDAAGRGLFDPHDAMRNAQIAYDSQVVQRVLWRLRESGDAVLREELRDYLDRLAPTAPWQAVA
jgi:energy-coupling factor transporter ATP-binding protein EcfA2